MTKKTGTILSVFFCVFFLNVNSASSFHPFILLTHYKEPHAFGCATMTLLYNHKEVYGLCLKNKRVQLNRKRRDGGGQHCLFDLG